MNDQVTGWEHAQLDGARLEVLDRVQCLDLLDTARVGRLCFTDRGVPAVQPVNYRLFRGDPVIRVAGGAKLAAAVTRAVVAFEVDDLDHELRSGWNVTVVGPAGRITDVDELVAVSGIWLRSWAPGRLDAFVRIRTDRVSGRRLHRLRNGASHT